jgi:sodium transport system permease protein
MFKLKTLINKELKRFFTDRRMLSTLLLPGVFIYILYTVIGNVGASMGEVDDSYIYQVAVVNFPEELGFIHDQFESPLDVQFLTSRNDDLIQNVEERTLDLYIVFEADFYANMVAYDIASGLPAPHVEIFYNSAADESGAIYQYYTGMLNAFERQISNKFDINRSVDVSYNQATAADFSRQFVTGLVPFLLIVFLFSGSQAIAVESIAGEKERNTMGTLLATPTSRSQIALGKIIALSITALVSAASSFLGVMLSLPQLVGDDSFTLAIYGLETYLLLFVIIMTTVLIFVVLLSLISAYAKSIKEAATLAAPLMIVIYLVGVTSLFGTSQTNLWFYLIPIYNSVQSLTAVFDLSISIPQLTLTILSNLALLGIGVYLLTLAFDSEKMMFNK